MKEQKRDLDEQDATELPDREAMSLIDPGRLAGGPLPPIVAPDGAPNDQLATTGQGMVEKPPTT